MDENRPCDDVPIEGINEDGSLKLAWIPSATMYLDMTNPERPRIRSTISKDDSDAARKREEGRRVEQDPVRLLPLLLAFADLDCRTFREEAQSLDCCTT